MPSAFAVPEVDGKFKFGWLQDHAVGWFLALKDPPDINPSLAKRGREDWNRSSLAHRRPTSVRLLAIAGIECCFVSAIILSVHPLHGRIGLDEQCVGALLRHRSERGLQFTLFVERRDR